MDDERANRSHTAVDDKAARHLRELVLHLEDVARAAGHNLDVPDPLFFRDLLEILAGLGVTPGEFFHGVIRRWQRMRRRRM